MKNLLYVYFIISSSLAFSQEKSKYNFSKIDSIGYAIDSTLYSLNNEYFNQVFDYQKFFSRVIIHSDEGDIKTFNIGFLQGISNNFNLGNILIAEIEKGGSYDYLRFYLDDNEQFHIIFRLYSDEGLNYHDFLVEKVDDDYRIIDMYVFLTGENMSETLKSIYLGFLPNKDNSEIDKNSYLSILKVKKIKELIKSNQFQEAYDLYNEIPSKYKKEKLYKIVLIQVTSNLSEDLYIKAIEDYATSFPNDPSLQLILIDRNFLKGKFDKCLENIEALNVALEGDSFLDLYRGNIYYEKKELEKSKEYFLNLINNFPDFFDGYDSLLTIYVEEKSDGKAIDILNTMVNKSFFTKEDLIILIKESFKEFSESEAFKEWSTKE